MDRNTLTTAGELVTGDRFYKKKDKNKTVYEKHASTSSQYMTCKKDGEKFFNYFKVDIPVVFLRNSTS